MENIIEYLENAIEDGEQKVLEVLDKSGECDELIYHIGHLNALKQMYTKVISERDNIADEINIFILM